VTTPGGNVIATAFVEIVPIVRNFARQLRQQLQGAEASLRGTARSLRGLNRDLSVVRSSFASMARTLTGLNTALPLTIRGFQALAAVSIVGGIVALGGALTELSGALGVLPAAGLAAAAGMGTLFVGLLGVERALKHFIAGKFDKFNADLEKLSVNARETLGVLNEFKPQLIAFRNAVQDALFFDLANVARDLGRVILPRVQQNFVGIAQVMNQAARDLAAFVLSADTLRDVDFVSGRIVRAFQLLRPSVLNVAFALRDVTAVGAQFLPGLASEVSVVTARFRQFIAQARASGALESFIARGIVAVHNIAQIFFNLGRGIAAILFGAREAGVSLIGAVERLTQRFADFFTSVRGQTALQKFLVHAHDAAVALGPVIAAFVSLIVEHLFPILEDFATTVGPAVVVFFKALGQALDVAAPGIHDLAEGFGNFLIALTPALPAIGRLVSALGTLLGTVLERLGPALADLIVALVEALLPVVEVLTDLISKLTKEQLTWIIGIGLAVFALTALAQALVGIFSLASLLLGGLRLLISPVGLVVLAIAALVALLVHAWKNSATFREIIRTVGRALGVLFDVIKEVWRELEGPFKAAFAALRPLLIPLAKFIGLVLLGLVAFLTGVAVIIFGIVKIIEFLVKALVEVVKFVAKVVEGGLKIAEKIAGFLGSGVDDLNRWVAESTAAATASEEQFGRIGGAVFSFSNDVKRAFEEIGVISQGAMGEAGGAVFGFLDDIKNAFSQAVTHAQTGMAAIIDAIKGMHTPLGAAGSAVGAFATGTATSFNQAAGAVGSAIGLIKSTLTGAAPAVGQAGSVLGGSFTGGLKGGIGGAIGVAHDIIAAVNGVFFGANFGAAGAAATRSFASGMRALLNEVRAASRSVAGAAGSALPLSPAKEGPFSGRGWTPFRGRSLAQGFAEGIESGLQVVRTASAHLAREASTGLGVGLASVPTPALRDVTSPTSTGVAPVVVTPRSETNVRVFIDGRELRGVVVDVVDGRDRALRRGVQSGVGGAR
jgi:phage-related protein